MSFGSTHIFRYREVRSYIDIKRNDLWFTAAKKTDEWSGEVECGEIRFGGDRISGLRIPELRARLQALPRESSNLSSTSRF